jgi:hypothetical protein
VKELKTQMEVLQSSRVSPEDGESLTISASHLSQAIDNASNTIMALRGAEPETLLKEAQAAFGCRPKAMIALKATRDTAQRRYLVKFDNPEAKRQAIASAVAARKHNPQLTISFQPALTKPEQTFVYKVIHPIASVIKKDARFDAVYVGTVLYVSRAGDPTSRKVLDVSSYTPSTVPPSTACPKLATMLQSLFPASHSTSSTPPSTPKSSADDEMAEAGTSGTNKRLPSPLSSNPKSKKAAYSTITKNGPASNTRSHAGTSGPAGSA